MTTSSTWQQLNCVKEMSLEETGDNFQKAGYNVLLYDARSIGGSGGFPRNQPDPWKYVEDLSGKWETIRCVNTFTVVQKHASP